MKLYLKKKKTFTKKDWWSSSRCRPWIQYHKRKRKLVIRKSRRKEINGKISLHQQNKGKDPCFPKDDVNRGKILIITLTG
jgi:hypothetical protein